MNKNAQIPGYCKGDVNAWCSGMFDHIMQGLFYTKKNITAQLTARKDLRMFSRRVKNAMDIMSGQVVGGIGPCIAEEIIDTISIQLKKAS